LSIRTSAADIVSVRLAQSHYKTFFSRFFEVPYCNKVLMSEVDPDYQFPDELFVDWLRKELVLSATMNQCHRRYILLISPVSTATAMGFKDANSLKSYASFTLVTPSELAFTEGNNGAFAAPAIRPDSPLFTGFYGLAWSTKGKKWLGVPALDKSVIDLRESQPPKLNYFAKPIYVGEQRYPAQMLGTAPAEVPIGSTTTKAKSKAVDLPDPQTDDERHAVELDQLFDAAILMLRTSPNTPITISKLIPTEKARKRHGVEIIGRLANNGNIQYEAVKRGSVTSHSFVWLVETVGDDDSFDDEIQID
jgi:hypothetical protein